MGKPFNENLEKLLDEKLLDKRTAAYRDVMAAIKAKRAELQEIAPGHERAGSG